MYFLYPSVLWALSLLTIPVIIHFFNIRRYKKIYFSDIKLIRQITQESQVKNKIKEYIVLVLRILALLFLIMAFAQPVKRNKMSLLKQKNQDVVIYIDNSFSMENMSEQGKLFEMAISKAKEVIQSFSKSTEFIILTNHKEFVQKKLSPSSALEYLSKIRISSSSVPLSLLLNRIYSMHLSNPVVFIFSDAQKKFTDIPQVTQSTVPVYYFLLKANQKNNISIDSVWTDNPVVLSNNQQQLRIKVTNHNSESVKNLPVKITLNDAQIAILNVSVPAHQSTEASATFIPPKKNFQFGKVYINDFPVSFDDELYFSINSDVHIKCLLINGLKNPSSSKYIRTFFQNDSIFVFSEQSESQINFSEITQQDVVVLNEITEFSTGLEEQLKILSQKGKTVIIIPYIEKNVFVLPSDIQSMKWQIDTTKQSVSQSVLKHSLLMPAFEKTDNSYKLPYVKEYLTTSYLNNAEPIIELNNAKPLLFKYQHNEKKYFVFTSTLQSEKTQLPIHSLFVPLMYQLAFTAVPQLPLYYYCETSEKIKVPNVQFTADHSPKIISAQKENTNFQIIPSFYTNMQTSYITIPAQNAILPGHYYLQWKENNIRALSFNYNRAESDMQFYSEKELKDIVLQYQKKDFVVNDVSHLPVQNIIQSRINHTSYWKMCLILSLIFFSAESIINRKS